MQCGSCRFHASLILNLLRAFIRRFNSDKEPVPFVMFTGRGGSPALERSIEQIEIGNPIHVYPTPIRKSSTTGAADLVTKEPHTAFLNSVVVGFENPIPVL